MERVGPIETCVHSNHPIPMPILPVSVAVIVAGYVRQSQQLMMIEGGLRRNATTSAVATNNTNCIYNDSLLEGQKGMFCSQSTTPLILSAGGVVRSLRAPMMYRRQEERE